MAKKAKKDIEMVTKKDLIKELGVLKGNLEKATDSVKKAEVTEQIAAVQESLKVIEESEAILQAEEAARAKKAAEEAEKTAAKEAADAEKLRIEAAKDSEKDINELGAIVKESTPISPKKLYFSKSFWSVELGRSIKKGTYTCRSKEEYEALKNRNSDDKVMGVK
ncbi:MAG: hypothetical protein ACTSW1_08205 [Candidatus Hodarchaeales archaeon]